MKIAYLIREDIKGIVSPCYYELIREIQRQGHKVVVLNEKGSFASMKTIKCNPLHVIDYPSGAFNKILFSAKAKELIERIEPDLVFGSLPESIYFLEKIKAPKIVMVQDDLKGRIGFTPWLSNFGIKYGFMPVSVPKYTKIGVIIDYYFQINSLRKADGIVFVNKEAKNEYKNKNPIAIVIPNGVNAKEFLLNKKIRREIRKIKDAYPEPIILFMARLDLQKAPLDFVKAAKKVLLKRKAYFLIAGDGPMRKAVERGIKKLNLGNRVKTLGWKNGVQKKALLHACNVYVLPSLFDPMPVSLLEAMACSKPVIVSNVGGMRNTVNKKSGIKIPAGNIEKMVDAIIFMLENPGKAKEMGINARKRIEEFYDWKVIAKKYIEFFNKVKNKKSGLDG